MLSQIDYFGHFHSLMPRYPAITALEKMIYLICPLFWLLIAAAIMLIIISDTAAEAPSAGYRPPAWGQSEPNFTSIFHQISRHDIHTLPSR